MAYHTKQQTLKQWAELVIEGEVHNLKQIQQADFTSKLLLKLDPQYFTNVLQTYTEGITFSQLFLQISRYYSRQIGTNIEQIMGQDANIYSTSSIEQIWQLILGIAIKGRNRQQNINTILKMKPETQQDLMRIISKLINNLGENVSVIDGPNNKITSQIGVPNSNDTDLIVQLSQQNEQLKQKLDEMSYQIITLKQKNKNLKVQLDEKVKQRSSIIDLMIRQSMSTKISVSSSHKSSDIIIEFMKDLIGQVGTLTKQLSKKQQRQLYLEQMNRDLKIAYSATVADLDHVKNTVTNNTVDVDEFERKIQQLRSQNLEYIEREKDFIAKIGDLQQQRFYLKDIIQRLQTKLNKSEQKVQKIIEIKQNKQNLKTESQIYEEQQKQHRAKTVRVLARDSVDRQPQSPIKNIRTNTVRGQFDQIKNPNQKNKLQRQISHLQKKVNSIQQQNTSLKKINGILEKVINDFTKQSSQMMQKYESEIEPMFEQFRKIIQEEQLSKKKIQEQSQTAQSQNQLKIKQLMNKMKLKIEQYDNRCIQYQKIIKKLQIERDELLKNLQLYKQKPAVIQTVIQQVVKQVVKEKPKPKPQLSNKNMQITILATPQQKKQAQVVQIPMKQIKQQQKPKQEPKQRPKQEPQIKIENIISQTHPKQSIIEQQVYTLKAPEAVQMRANQNVAASILMQQQEQEGSARKRQYSFMGSRQSTYVFGQQNHLGLKQKSNNLHKLTSLGSQIQQQTHQLGQQNIQNEEGYAQGMSHVQIIDITQIQQQLSKIKQHYLQLNNQNQSMCQLLKSSKNETKIQKGQQSKMTEIVKNLQQMSIPNKESEQKLAQYFKKLQKQGMDRAHITTQNIKIKQQNAALRQQLSMIKKQRKSVQERLLNLQKQSAKTLDEKTKQELSRLSEALSQIKSIMLQSQNSYLQLQDYMQTMMMNQTQQINALNSQVKQLKQQLKLKDCAVIQLQMETNLLMTAVLEFRNSAIRSF